MKSDAAESPLRYPFAEPPAAGSTILVAPGIRWAQLPLPFRLNHVNVWLIEESDGWSLIDCGIGDERTFGLWEQLLAGDLGGRPIRRVVATHFHPDHVGAAGWLLQRFDAAFHMSQTEWLVSRLLRLENDAQAVRPLAAWYHRHGLDEETRTALVGHGGRYAKLVTPLPAWYHRVHDGDQLRLGGRDWQVSLHGGHSPEQVLLQNLPDGVLISSDQVLPRISPNVSVGSTDPFGDPLSEFLDSLARLRTLPNDLLVLPMHGLPFYGLHERIDMLRAHHQERLSFLLDLTAEPRTAAEITKGLFRRELDVQQMSFAIGEAVAHVNHLVRTGALQRETRADGVDLYQRA